MHGAYQGQGYQARDDCAPLSARPRLPLPHKRQTPARHPDIVLRKYKTVIFINGCFWHGHEGCKYFVMPKSNTAFWKKKIERNKQRDIEKRVQLRRLGWHTIIIWGCELLPKKRHTTLQALEQTLNKIFLLNNGAKVIADYSYEEENIGMVAEE